ncbi:MAG: hypothetical protein K0S55_841 [Clostridia bacterium]|nr:hypothetical protein [Clostridia bacterium]
MIKNLLKLKRLWFLILLPISIIITAAARINVEFAEWYSTVIYPNMSIFINRISSLVNFSLAEIILILLVITVILYIVLYIFYILKSKNNYILNSIKFVLNIFIVFCIIIFIFTILNGINYHRMTFSDKIGLHVKPSSKALLIDLCKDLSLKANELKKMIKNDDFIDYNNFKSIAEKAQNSYDKISDIYPNLIVGYDKAKPVFFSKIMSYSKITGFFFPFTFEANVNIDVPIYTIPATICHELTHLRGYMREDEANFISYLTCINSDSIDFQYSGIITAFIYATNALYKVDKAAYSEIYNNLNEGVKSDLKTGSDYWKQFDGLIANISNKVNDTYLKANNQKDGIESYGRMVDLLLSYYLLKKAD